jgi:hypothetical protein
LVQKGNGIVAVHAQLLKKEVVEFMKYRGPIEGVKDIYDRFASSQKEMTEAQTNAQIVEKESEYAQSKADVMGAAKDVYDAIVAYENAAITPEEITDISNVISGLENDYRSAHTTMVKDLYNTQGIQTYNADIFNLNLSYEVQDSSVDVTKIDTYIDNTAKSMSAFAKAAADLDGAGILKYDAQTMYDIQYWVDCDNKLSGNDLYGKYIATAQVLNVNIKILEKAWSLLGEEEQQTGYDLKKYKYCNTSGQKTYSQHYEALSEQYETLADTYFRKSDTPYTRIAGSLASITQNNQERINTTAVNDKITSIYQKISGFRDRCEDARKKADKVVKTLDVLKARINQMQEDYSDWESLVNQSDTDLANDQKTGELLTEKEAAESFSIDEIETFKTRLQNIKKLMKDLETAVDEVSYNGTSVKDIKNYNEFKNASGIDVTKITYVAKDLDNYANSSFQFQGSSSMSSIKVTNDNNPKLTVQEPELHKKLVEQFKDATNTQEADTKLKQEEDVAKDAITKEETGNNNSDKELQAMPDRVSTGSLDDKTIHSDDENRISKKTGLSSLTNNVNSWSFSIANTLTAARDDLYATEYIMKMFSYDTYTSEAKYRYEHADEYPADVGTVSGDYDADLTSTDPTIRFNKTLTNKVISTDNNYSYGNEVEYIIYGGTNQKNKASSYATIFAIRFALNLYAKGQKVGELIFDDADLFAENDGYAAVKTNGKWGFVDKSGNMVIQSEYDNARSFSNGFAAVKVNGKWGFIDEDGNMVIEPQFEDAKYFTSKGTVFVKENGAWVMASLLKYNY